MFEYVWFVFIGTLATWRLARIIGQERIARPLRQRLGEKIDIVGNPTYPDTFWGYLISCFRCLSVWGGIIVVILFLIHPLLPLPLALSMLSIVLEERAGV